MADEEVRRLVASLDAMTEYASQYIEEYKRLYAGTRNDDYITRMEDDLETARQLLAKYPPVSQ